jgi:molybdopterin molybdotransferase
MISIREALEIVSGRADAVVSEDCMPAESVRLGAATGRVLREEVRADLDSPPFERSIRDGYALRFRDVSSPPVDLQVVGESRAGASFRGDLAPGTCCEIMTGAEVPAGADAVVMVEHTETLPGGRVRILRAAARGQSIQAAGSECRKEDLVLAPGRAIGASEAGVLASTGHAEVVVSRRPRVAIVSTGDELVEVARVPGPAQIRNSNSVTLAAQVVEAGGEPRLLGIARDEPAHLAGLIGQGLECDVLISSGGVSMGKYDLVIGVLEGHGVQIGFDRVAMKPGKPTVFGWRDQTFVFGLPGNPVSTIVSFQLFVRPLIQRLLHAGALPAPLEAILDSGVRCDPQREACVPARVRFERGRYRLAIVEWKGSSDLVGLARANAYVLIPRRDGVLEPGTEVGFIPMRPPPPA